MGHGRRDSRHGEGLENKTFSGFAVSAPQAGRARRRAAAQQPKERRCLLSYGRRNFFPALQDSLPDGHHKTENIGRTGVTVGIFALPSERSQTFGQRRRGEAVPPTIARSLDPFSAEIKSREC